MTWCVVDAGDQDVFHQDGQPVSRGPSVHGGAKIGKWFRAVDGHDGLADLVVGGIQTDGQAELAKPRFIGELGQAFNALRTAHRRHRNAGGGNGGAAMLGQNSDGLEDCFDVVGGLAHAHEHDVGDGLLLAVTRGEPLAHDLVRGELFSAPQGGGFAKSTAHRASNLRRDTKTGADPAGAAPLGQDHTLGFQTSFELLGEFQGGAIRFAAHDGHRGELDFALKSRRKGPLTKQLTPAAGGGGGGQIQMFGLSHKL